MCETFLCNIDRYKTKQAYHQATLSRVLEELTGTQLAVILSAFYTIRRFVTVATRPKRINNTPSPPFSLESLNINYTYIPGPGCRSQYSDCLRAERSGIETPMGGYIFSLLKTRPGRPWDPPSLLYNEYRWSSGVKRPARGLDHLPQYSAEVENWWSTTCYEVNFTFKHIANILYRNW
jgi:hypothetical protein